MKVKVSWDEGSTFEDACDLSECFPDADDPEHAEAERELLRCGRYWCGGGAAALSLLIRVE